MPITNRPSLQAPCGTGFSLSSRGSALLAVLWLSVALSTIALTVASTVRGEVDRAATASDDTRAYFLAQSAIYRGILYIEWGRMYGSPNYYQPGMPPLEFHFPGGDVTVEIMPESSKLNINLCPPADLFRLLSALGVAQERAQAITEAVVDWRSVVPGGQPTPFDMFYSQQTPSFVSPHASFQEIEDLLLVRGVTPELFYGTWDRDESVQPPRLTQRIRIARLRFDLCEWFVGREFYTFPRAHCRRFTARCRCRHRGTAANPAFSQYGSGSRVYAKHGASGEPAHVGRPFDVHHSSHRTAPHGWRRGQRYEAERFRPGQVQSAGWQFTLSHCQVV